jgi:hypothetical protein
MKLWGLPETGWEKKGVTDLVAAGKGLGTCECCGRPKLRFLHTIEHPQFGKLHVGGQCAQHLCNGYSPQYEERRLRNVWAKRNRWLGRNWRVSEKGDPYLTIFDNKTKVVVVILAGPTGCWRYRVLVNGGWSDEGVVFQTADSEKLGAFDRLAELLGWGTAPAMQVQN